MPGFKFSDFRSAVKDVARPNRFLVSLATPPTGIPNFNFDPDLQYHVRSASIPSRTNGDITNLMWFGLNYKIVGDPSFDDYSISFLNNIDWKVRNLFEEWMQGIIDPVKNVRLSPNDYKGILQLEQLGPINEPIARYYLHGAYPKSIDAIELSQEAVDAIEDFSVNFSVDYWSRTNKPSDSDIYPPKIS